MKYLLPICLFWFGLSSLHSQTVSSDCLCTQQLVQVYKNDAYRLAYKRIHDLGFPAKDSVIIPLPVVDSILKNLALINNIPPSSLRDTLMEIFGTTDFFSYYYTLGEDSSHVHGFIPSLRKTTVVVAQGTPFAADWIAGNYTATADPQINTLMTQYGLTAQLNFSISGTHNFTVRSARNLNTQALANHFKAVAGVNSGSTMPVSLYGDGCRILYSRSGSVTNLSYEFRCGDCPAGCTGMRKWDFSIADNSCNVQYLGTSSSNASVNPPFNMACEITIPPGGYGSPAPGNTQCTAGNFIIASLAASPTRSPRIKNHDFTLHPNPAGAELHIRLPQNLDRRKTIRITDSNGKPVLTTMHNERVNRLELDIRHLPPGAYSLTIETPYSFNTLRFVKI